MGFFSWAWTADRIQHEDAKDTKRMFCRNSIRVLCVLRVLGGFPLLRRAKLLQAGEVVGEGFGDAGGVEDADAGGAEADEGEGHGHAVVVVGGDLGRTDGG